MEEISSEKKRIFVSFLGTSNYELCRYRFGDDPASEEKKFVQSVTAERAACDENVIFCTDGAKSKHWNDGEGGTGLVTEFRQAGLPDPNSVRICDGASEEGLWEIFDTIQKEIPENASITFDVTHSFRFLPLLMTILLNYLKEIKNVELEKCYYGAYEARDRDTNIAPVFDLTPFFVLNDWARAASFLQGAGDSAPLLELVKSKNGKLWKEKKVSKEELKFSSELTKSVNTINDQIAAVRTCRGNAIKEADKSKIFPVEEIETLQKHFPAFVPLYKQLRNFYPEYVKNDERNGLLAAKWCADHGMIQQGYTILQETIITLVLDKWAGDAEKRWLINRARELKTRKGLRELINACLLHGGGDEWNKPEWTIEETKILRSGDEVIANIQADISGIRNDINHAGLEDNSAPSAKLRAKLSEFVNAAVSIFGLPRNCHD